MGKAKAKDDAKSSVSINLPLKEVEPQSWGIHVDLRLSSRQSNALRRIIAGLNGQLGSLAHASGRASGNGAIKLILEMAADEMGLDESGQSR